MVLIQEKILELAGQLKQVLLPHNLYCTVAESCTGGSLSAAITDIDGCSQWFDRGFITYSNQAKVELLGVDYQLIVEHGAVSDIVACAMADGALAVSRAQLSVAISGIAGPTGGSKQKPVGTVWIAWAAEGLVTKSECFLWTGNRHDIRMQAVAQSLLGLITLAKQLVLFRTSQAPAI
ncbi:MAG: CinA family protein [Legionella sp.]